MSGAEGAVITIGMFTFAIMVFELYVLHEWKKLDNLEKKAKRRPKSC